MSNGISQTSSLHVQLALNRATGVVDDIFQKLSSGQRINKASDDAAGLAIADSLRARSRVFSQGVRNLNDGQSLLNIADSATETLGSIVGRLQELAEQAANGNYSAKQRNALDAEAQGLAREYFRIARTTSFNGINVFDGSLGQGIRIQDGFGADGGIQSSLGGAVGTGTFNTAATVAVNGQTFGSQDIVAADLNGDGNVDLVIGGWQAAVFTGVITVALGNGDGTFTAGATYSTSGNIVQGVKLNDLNNDGIYDLVAGGQGNGGLYIRLGRGDGTFGAIVTYQGEPLSTNALAIADINGDGFSDIVPAGETGRAGEVSVRLGNGNGTFRAKSTYSSELAGSYAVSLTDLNSDGVLDLVTGGSNNTGIGPSQVTVRLGTGGGAFGSASAYVIAGLNVTDLALGDVNGDGVADLVTSGYEVSGFAGFATVRLGNGDGTFRAAASYAQDAQTSTELTLADLNGDGILDFATTGTTVGNLSQATIRLGNGDGTFRAAVSTLTGSRLGNAITAADINGDGVFDLLTAGSTATNAGFYSVQTAVAIDGISPLIPFSLKTQADALQALGQFNSAQSRLSLQRGKIGAFESRLQTAVNVMQSSTGNLTAAESRIRDVDIADASSDLVRNQILQQAATSVLAHVNSSSAIVLKLIQ